MALTQTQKKWAVGGSIGAVALFVGYKIFGRPAFARGLPSAHGHEKHEHHGKKKHHEDHGDENERGEYGRKKKHRHKEHHGG